VFGNLGTAETTFLAALAAPAATDLLPLHASSAVGIAAGDALITGEPAVVSLHTDPGLANGMFNMRNALKVHCSMPRPATSTATTGRASDAMRPTRPWRAAWRT